MMRFGIIAKPHLEAADTLRPFLSYLRERRIETVLDTETAAVVGETSPYQKSQIPAQVDFIAVLGGDGTLLSVARLIGCYDVPIFGVNLGSLGFLTEITLDELYPTLDQVIAGEVEYDERIMLTAKVLRQGEKISRCIVLNDIVINKSALAKIIDMEAYIDGRYVANFKADGLIISTPTGSTAYNLAAGGPIVHPKMHAIILAPICPHILTNRPVVVQDDSQIEIVLKSENTEVLLTLDGQVGFSLRGGDVIQIEKATCTIKLISCPGKTYFDILRTKLKWTQR
jgi:NAD+ kinase